MSVMHAVELLELVGCEDGGELLVGLLVDRFHLLLYGFGGDRGVLSQGGDFVVAVGENGLEFRCLIGREIEFFAELRGFTLGVVGMVVFRRGSRGGVLLLLLCEDETAGKPGPGRWKVKGGSWKALLVAAVAAVWRNKHAGGRMLRGSASLLARTLGVELCFLGRERPFGEDQRKAAGGSLLKSAGLRVKTIC